MNYAEDKAAQEEATVIFHFYTGDMGLHVQGPWDAAIGRHVKADEWIAVSNDHSIKWG